MDGADASGIARKGKKKKKRRPLDGAAEVAGVDKVDSAAPVAGETVVLKKKKKKRRVDAAQETTPVKPAPPAAETFALVKKKKKRKAQEALEELPTFKKKAKGEAAPGNSQPAGEKKSSEASADSTVFVDGVPYAWSVSQVEDYFKKCGQVTAVRAPTWQDSGRLRGYAHVTFADKASRDKALALDGSKVDKKGRFLKIEPAKAPAAAEAPAAADVEGKRRLFVKNLPYDCTEKAIADLFGKCGKIREVRVPTSFGRCKGFAYVEFARAEHLKAAISLQPPPSLQGRTLRLDVDSGSGPKAGFHYRQEAFEAGYGPKRGKDGKGKDGKGRGGGKGRGKGKGLPKLSLF